MSNEILETYAKMGDIVLSTNAVILNPSIFLHRDTLNARDIKWYLDRHRDAQKTLFSGIGFSGSDSVSHRAKTLEGAIDNWDSDRTKTLYCLVEMMAGTAMQGRGGATAAAVECAKVLVEEALIPSQDFDSYHRAVRASDIAFDSALKEEGKGSVVTNLLRVCSTGIVYNAAIFCPHIFDIKIYSGHVNQARGIYYDSIDELIKVAGSI